MISSIQRHGQVHAAAAYRATALHTAPAPTCSALQAADRLTLLSVRSAPSAPLDPPKGVAPLKLTSGELKDRLGGPLGIGVLVERQSIALTSNALAQVEANGKDVASLFPGEKLQARFEQNGIALYGADSVLIGRYAGPLTIKTEALTDGGSPPAVAVDGKTYRGEMELAIDPQTGGGINAINRVPLDQYLYGVVPAEMPSSWDEEALKAQAVAARTYAVANLGRRAEHGFDLYATTADQVYKGLSGEEPTATQAVDQTTGIFITYQGQPINAVFHSNAGGHTEDMKDVWGFDLPYIKGVPDFDQSAPRYHWTQNYTTEQVNAAALQIGAHVGQVTALQPTEYTPWGRVSRLRLVGTTGSAEVDGNKFRLALGLYSTLYKAIPVTTPVPGFRFDGQGWGHGLGLSQYGARTLAGQGQNFEQILKHYYTGVELTEKA